MKMEAGIDDVRRIIRNKIYDKLLQDDALYQELFENHYQVVVNTWFHVDGYRHEFLNVDSGIIRIEQMRDLFAKPSTRAFSTQTITALVRFRLQPSTS